MATQAKRCGETLERLVSGSTLAPHQSDGSLTTTRERSGGLKLLAGHQGWESGHTGPPRGGGRQEIEEIGLFSLEGEGGAEDEGEEGGPRPP